MFILITNIVKNNVIWFLINRHTFCLTEIMGFIFPALLIAGAFIFIFYWFLYGRTNALPASLGNRIILSLLLLYPFLCAFLLMMVINLLDVDLPYPGVLFFFFQFLLAMFSVAVAIRLYKIHRVFAVHGILNSLAGILYFGGMMGGII